MASVAHEYLATDPISNDAHSLFIFNLLQCRHDEQFISLRKVRNIKILSQNILSHNAITRYTDTVVNVVVTDYHSNGLGVKVQSCPTVRTSTDLSEVDCGGARFHRHIVASR
jgi:hypothetical protein